MPIKSIKFLLVIVLIVFSISLHARESVYSVGVVPQFDSRKVFKIWNPILKELEKSTGLIFELVGSPNIPEFEHKFQAGVFDFVYLNPFHMLVAKVAQDYQPLVRDHGRALKGILVVRKDSQINSVKELDGKIVAFPAPNALGASLLMRAELENLFGIKVQPKYVKNHKNVYLKVVRKNAAAGGGVKRTLVAQPARIKDDLRIIHTTREVAPHPFAVHPRVAKEIQEKVRAGLLKMGKTEESRRLLKQVPIREIGESKFEDYLILRDWGLKKFYVK